MEILDCSYNQLTSLNLSNNTALAQLDCSNNDLTSLDISNNAALTELNCSSNDLTLLDISSNVVLAELRCNNNSLTSLDASNNVALEILYCMNNQLTSLDVSNNIALGYLDCSYNKLTSLDISNNNALLYLTLDHMPTLHEVCVWTMPFPYNVYLDTVGSHNLYLADCAVNIPGDYKENSTKNIYPNPTDDIINIEIGNINNATIEIYNISGRLVFSKELDSRIEKIDISGLSEGLFFVKVRQKNNISIEKLIVY